MRLISPAFENGQSIPRRYSGEDENVSPPLNWCDVPQRTKSFALICTDPDAPAGTFRHWAAYNIAAQDDELPEALPRNHITGGLKQAVNDFGRHGYGGPMPPRGHGPHRYRFRLIALDTEALMLGPESSVSDVERAVLAHKIAEAELTGIYERT